MTARLDAVEATVGEDYRQIVARVGEARTERDHCRREVLRATALLVGLAGRIGELRATSAQDAELREKAVAARDGAAHRFRHLCLVGLAEDAGWAPGLDAGDGTRATLDAARALAAQWPSLPYAPRNLGDAASRLSEAVHEARGHLGVRADLDLEPDDDIQLFSAALDGVRVGAAGLLTTLTQERDRSRDDISTAERRLFDQILTGDIRRHLAARIRRAGKLVQHMIETSTAPRAVGGPHGGSVQRADHAAAGHVIQPRGSAAECHAPRSTGVAREVYEQFGVGSVVPMGGRPAAVSLRRPVGHHKARSRASQTASHSA
ncbi:hypothetical protein [Streptomyces roseolus]|uniref:hypothetical protein n=1 Tax=Streptomyces roseolus TaxID=67358 RepID=UPI003570E6A9